MSRQQSWAHSRPCSTSQSPPKWGSRAAPGHPVPCRALEMLQVLSPEPPCPGPCTVRSGTRNPPRQPLSVPDQGVDPQAEPRMPSCQQGLLLLQHFPFPWTFTNCVNTSPAPAAYGANSIVKPESTSKAQVKSESTGKTRKHRSVVKTSWKTKHLCNTERVEVKKFLGMREDEEEEQLTADLYGAAWCQHLSMSLTYFQSLQSILKSQK